MIAEKRKLFSLFKILTLHNLTRDMDKSLLMAQI